jgi:ABC-2 type transport system permease protein
VKGLRTVIGFEYKGFVSAKSFKIVTIFIVAVVLILSFLPQILSSFQGDEDTSGQNRKDTAIVLLTGDAAADAVLKQAFSAAALEKVFTGTKWLDGATEGYDAGEIEKRVADGKAVYAVSYDGGNKYKFYAPGNKLTAYSAVAVLDSYVTDVARQAAIAKLPADVQGSAQQIAGLTAEADIVEIGGNAENNFWIGYVLMFFLYFVLMAYGNYISSSVITEKTSKAMELLITAAKPIDLMAGKVIGVGLAAMTQVVCIIAAVAIGLACNLSQWKAFQPTVFEALSGANISVGLALVLFTFFVLGFFLYAFLLAALASTVAKPEEAATVTIIPILLMIASFILGFIALSGAVSKTLIAVLSYVPFCTPFIMTSRFCLGDVSALGLIFGVADMAVSVVIVAVLAAKIYRVGVMMYGSTGGLKAVVKALRS